MHSFLTWLSQLDFGFVWDYVVIIAASMICIMFHEVSHGVVALKLGDPTAKNAGRLTFNPLRHIDIWGLLMMAIFKFGWAKAVPVDMRNFKHPVRDMAITAAAGPISNITLAFFALCIRAGALYVSQRTGGVISDFVVTFTEYVALLSVGLAVFNVIPIPPLDGSKVLNALLPERIYYRILRYERYGFLVMMVVLYTGILDTPLTLCRSLLLKGLSVISAFPYYILGHIFG
jgi:Zn-dependent protease